MGYDAYHLVAPLFAARAGTMPEIDGASGRLYLDNDGRIHRELAWAEFQRGEPVALPDPDSLPDPIHEFGEDSDVLHDDGSMSWSESTPER